MNEKQFLKNLEVPSERVDAILDTDTYNEIDDQFALAYMLMNGDKINTVGICAAPFLNSKSVSAEDGMEKSYDEIIHILTLMGRDDMKDKVYRGSKSFLKNEKEPVISDAAKYIVETAKDYSPENPLYVVAIGAITNVASAILLDPLTMKENTVIVWLGGNAHHCYAHKEFNMVQDVASARVVFASGAPIVQLPCLGVVSQFVTTEPELNYWLKGKNELADYLAQNVIDNYGVHDTPMAWGKCIWDVTAIAWLLNDGGRFMHSSIVDCPMPLYEGGYEFDPTRKIRYVERIYRAPLFTDLFLTLGGESDKLKNYRDAKKIGEII